ncbi:hypothetical protein PGT21_020810 [Puccinia graminis f. sp. tritici]|uniref:Proline dehydrogenase n=1 Tax=Puccinia graminis f. sp. tritici TaxID=56615 RepID=A0A5B0MTF6_PUCGR|nr:hypothetical protein PGT21_020810 [Puccinia graminis f. sp. tritici]
MKALYEGEVGSLLNYSVEALEGAGKGSSESGLSRESVAAITRTVESLAGYESGAKGYAASSARMKPSAVAIKVSGLVDDPYLFKRASENLLANGLSPFRSQRRLSEGQSGRHSCVGQNSYLPLGRIQQIEIRGTWVGELLTDGLQHFPGAPTVHAGATSRICRRGAQAGLFGGCEACPRAYLVSETARWREARAAGRPGVPDHPPVWASKAETDGCFDNLASSLVQQLASNARRAQGLTSHPRQSRSSNSIEVAMMIAGHNPISAAKVLKQLRDEEGLAKNVDAQSIRLSDSLRGRLMFAQLYGMADNLTSTLTQILARVTPIIKNTHSHSCSSIYHSAQWTRSYPISLVGQKRTHLSSKSKTANPSSVSNVNSLARRSVNESDLCFSSLKDSPNHFHS